ncbi:MAG TPA: hypothetical protein VGR06_17800 [Actinophytocola sp.]|jgi:hypothetical protein|uniref:hypothetical protein n=1 Tax=Actinophytocola sp. TaxID=1872138 RepID=UPI002E07DE6E|nr:hypothetical protein [Actinophytocola sp.]
MDFMVGLPAYLEPAARWKSLLRVLRKRSRQSDDGSMLVSLAFCHPKSIVLKDLKAEYVYLNDRSGTRWDLHFVGYRQRDGQRHPAGQPRWEFDAARFDETRRMVQDEHAAALASAEIPFESVGWRYSGRPELVSFMAYRDYPGLIDWLSLRSVRLVDANGRYLDRSLSEIVEVLSDWRDLDNDIRDLAPGEPPQIVSAAPISQALRATAAALASGIAGNAAYELLKAAIM